MYRHVSIAGVVGVALIAAVYAGLGVPTTLGSPGPAGPGAHTDLPEMGGAGTGPNTTTTTATAGGTTTGSPTTTATTSTPTPTAADATTTPSSATTEQARQGDHYVIVRGGSPSNPVDYRFTVTGGLAKAAGQSDWPVPPERISVDEDDAVEGRTATGGVAGGSDAFWYDGDITCFDVSSESSVTVYVDGEAVSPGDVAGGTECGAGDDGGDAGAGDGSGDAGDGTAADDQPTVSFPSCTEVRVEGLDGSDWELEYVSLQTWILDDWTRDGPPPIDTHMTGLPENDTGPVYSYADDGLVRGELYIIDGVRLTGPDGEFESQSNPHECEFVVGVSDNGTVEQPRS